MRCTCTLLALALGALSAGGSASAAPAPLDSATIYARVRAANGAAPINYRETIESDDSNGTVRRQTNFVRGDDSRADFLTGTVETQSGRYKSEAWHQNENGLTVVHELPPGVESPDPITTTTSAITSPVEGYKIARLNVRGYGTTDYVDAKTWQIVRSETTSIQGTRTTTYGPRVAFGDVHLPKTWHISSGAGIESDVTRLSYDVGVVTDADVQMPANRRTLVEFPPGVDTVTLPTSFAKDDHIFVRLVIDGIGYDFTLDSGAGGIYVDPGAVAKMHLETFNKSQSVTAGRYDTALAKIPALTIGPLAMHDIIVHVAPMTMNAPGVTSVGLLGFDFLAELGVKIDYDHKTVTVHRAGTYTVPDASPITNVLPIRLDTQRPYVLTRINGAAAERILLDTGGYGPFLLFDFFARRHPEALVDKDGGGLRSRPINLIGVGGRFETRAYELAEIDLGTTRYKNFIGWVVTSKSYGSDEDGVFGPGFLQVYDVFFDYPNGQVALTLNALGRRATGR